MPIAPRDVVAQLVEALNGHDLARHQALYDPEARLVTGSGRELDLDGLAELVGDTLKAFPDLRVEVRRWVCDDDTVVTEEVMEGTHQGEFAGLAPTGRVVRLPMVHVTRVAGDRIVERVAYHDTAGILRQLT